MNKVFALYLTLTLGCLLGFSPSAFADDQRLHILFSQQQSDVQIQGAGTVIKILPDDTQGSQHQKFIIELDSGQTLLVAHNIDLAPRVNNLQEGTRISFYGEYEWNAKGGVIHWTHKDPRNNHIHGWLQYNGTIYQ